MYKPLAGFVTRLIDNLSARDRHLPISDYYYDWLLDELEDGDYSFLELRDGNGSEVVKVKNWCNSLVIDRGMELTKPLAFRCGIGVSFIMTEQGVKDTVCQMTECS